METFSKVDPGDRFCFLAFDLRKVEKVSEENQDTMCTTRFDFIILDPTHNKTILDLTLLPGPGQTIMPPRTIL